MTNIKINPKVICKGTIGLINEKSSGGHMEDYMPDPNNKTKYFDLKWVPVSESFKKSR